MIINVFIGLIAECYEDRIREKGLKGRRFLNQARKLNSYLKEKRRDEIKSYLANLDNNN